MATISDIVTYKFKLLDTAGQPVTSLGVSLQYFKASTRTWEEVNRGVVTNGVYTFTETLDKAAYSVFLRESIIPEIRIVAIPPVYQSVKPEVLAYVFQFSSTTSTVNNATITNFLIDFGAAYLVDKDSAIAADVFSTFILISSPFPVANQAQLKKEIEMLKKELLTCQETTTQLLADNKAQATQIAALKVEVESKTATITALNTQLITTMSKLEQKTLEVTQLNTIRQQLENTISDLQQQIDELNRQLNFDEQPIPVNTLYSNLVREIELSTQNNQNANFKLANISLKLKTLLSSDENGINAQLFGLSQMDQINGAAVSEIVFDIAPSTTPAAQTGKMPNLLGLTETATRKILDSLGLRLNPVFQNNPRIVNGDSFKQTPAEGATYNMNDFVTVIFSKHE
jgi:hypothetical protein